MKKPTPPSYKWTPADHPELAFMNHEQRSCYRTLWDKCITAEGLPKDPLELAPAAEFSPAADFEKAVWNKIKKHFREGKNGKLWVGDLESQWEKDRKFRKSQGKKGKWKRENGLDGQPAVEPETNTGLTESPALEDLNKTDEPAGNRGLTGNKPEINREATAGEPQKIKVLSETKQETEKQPRANRKATKKEPAVDTKLVPNNSVPILTQDPKTPAIPVISKNKISEITTGKDSSFNQDWHLRQFTFIWPAGLTEEDKALFLKEIVNRHHWEELRKAASEYRRSLAPGVDPARFVNWFWDSKLGSASQKVLSA